MHSHKIILRIAKILPCLISCFAIGDVKLGVVIVYKLIKLIYVIEFK